MIKNYRFPIVLLLTVLFMAFIFSQSALPADLSTKESNVIVLGLADLLKADVDTVSFIVRKCAHFLEYTILGILLMLTVRAGYFRKGRVKITKACAVLAWAIGALYAISDEIHQHFVPGRSCEVRDMLIDACGTALGVIICLLVIRRRQRNAANEKTCEQKNGE